MVHHKEYFFKVYWKLHFWMEMVKALHKEFMKKCGYIHQQFAFDVLPLHVTKTAKKFLAFNEAMAKDYKLYVVLVNNQPNT